MRKYYLFWILLLVLAPILACRLPFGNQQGATGAGQTDLSAVTVTPAKETGQAEKSGDTGQQGDTVKPGDQPSAEAKPAKVGSTKFAGTASLGDVSAYRLSFSMDFDGKSGSQPAKGKITMLLEETKNPAARHMQMKMEGTTVASTTGANDMDMYMLGDQVYLKNAAMGQDWIAFSGDQAQSFQQGFFAPDKQLTMPDTANCDDQPQTVNGIAATHCAFTEKDVPTKEATFDRLQGEVWVAVEGKYIVKYVIKAEGYRPAKKEAGVMFDFGNISMVYELQALNQGVTITLPDAAKNAKPMQIPGKAGQSDSGAATAGGDIPKLDDAQNVVSAGGMLNYSTASNVTAVVDFYRQKLSAAGWKEDTSQTFKDDNTALLSFAKNGKTLMMTATKQGSRTNVVIVVE